VKMKREKPTVGTVILIFWCANKSREITKFNCGMFPDVQFSIFNTVDTEAGIFGKLDGGGGRGGEGAGWLPAREPARTPPPRGGVGSTLRKALMG